MEGTKYRFVRAKVEDRDRLLAFMRQHFYKYEPLNVCLGMPEGPSCTELIFSLSSLHEGTSLMAFDASDTEETQIVGICLNGESKRLQEGESLKDLISKCPCPKYAKLLKFVGEVETGGHVWKNTEADRALDLHAIAVDSSQRRQGLGQKLVEQSRRLAKEEGYPAVTMFCTSQYSASLAEKLGMRRVFMLRFDEYLDEDGSQVFKPPAPHVALKCYVQVIN